ncbi:hypothetical protein PG993_002014 [Apiospora rasikravindrae]|uniref:Uncharacterized protein n=1 Tax=Apiospora rasikravindrae TaxID=990691 RepID=A0ABR1UD13_9PEZI
MLFQWDPRSWRKVHRILITISFIITVYFEALLAWVLEPLSQRGAITNQTAGSTGVTTTGADEVSAPGVLETQEASRPPLPTPLSLEQRRTLDWVRHGSHDDSLYTFEYAQDVHRLEATVPDRPQSEGSEPRQVETEEPIDQDTVITLDDNDGQVEPSPQVEFPEEDTTEDVVEIITEEIQDKGASSATDGEETDPVTIERPTTSRSFHPEDERSDDDDEELAVTRPTFDINKEYELPQPDTEEEVVEDTPEEVVKDAPEEETTEDNIEIIPVPERTTEKRPHRRRRDTKRDVLMDLRSKLGLLQALREKEQESRAVASPSTTTTTARQKQQQNQEKEDRENHVAPVRQQLPEHKRAELVDLRGKLMLFVKMQEQQQHQQQEKEDRDNPVVNERPQLSEQRREELVNLRRKLMLFARMQGQGEAAPSAPEEPSILMPISEEKEEEELEREEPSNEPNQEPPSPSDELTDSDPETGADEIPLSPPPEELPQGAYDEDDEDEGLVDPFSSEGNGILVFIKDWLLLPEELSALEVLYQVANLRDTLTFVPGYVPTKHNLVREDEFLLVRSEPVPVEINLHFLTRLRSLRWRSLLRASDALIKPADRAWLESFLHEMSEPTFTMGVVRGNQEKPTTRPGEGKRRRPQQQQRRRRSTLLHQAEAAEPLLPHEEQAIRATNQTLWTRHAHEAATATMQAIYDNTEERFAWIDDRADEVRSGLEEMERSLLRLLDNLTSLESDVSLAVEVHGQEYTHLAGRIQRHLL